MKLSNSKTLIGRAEPVTFPKLGGEVLHARIDTGAKTSSVWASCIKETPRGLLVRLASSEYGIYQYEQYFEHYDRVRIASSMGQQEIRYRVKMSIVVGGRKIFATFTLADRSTQVYPILIGRATLAGKFIVDVQLGSPLLEAEKERSQKLQTKINEEHA